MIALRQTLFPEPVVPAMSMCGILVKSATSAAPLASLPRKSGSPIPVAASPASIISSLSRTVSLRVIGYFDPDGVLTGDRGDYADGVGFEGPGDVV